MEEFWCLSDMVQVVEGEGPEWRPWVIANYIVGPWALVSSQADPKTGAPVNGYGVVRGEAESTEIDRMVLDDKIDMICGPHTSVKLSQTVLGVQGVIAALQGRGVPTEGVGANTTAAEVLALVGDHIYGRAATTK